jgi:predicted RNA-binding protein associated with RNAse of E/G family
VDTARSIHVADHTVSYVDLFLDLSFHGGAWEVLDEEELALASLRDARAARAARAEVEALISRGDPLFDMRSEIWRVPPEALSLQPQEAPPLD